MTIVAQIPMTFMEGRFLAWKPQIISFDSESDWFILQTYKTDLRWEASYIWKVKVKNIFGKENLAYYKKEESNSEQRVT